MAWSQYHLAVAGGCEALNPTYLPNLATLQRLRTHPLPRGGTDSMPRHLATWSKSITICLLVISLFTAAACRRAELPAKPSKEYNDVVRAFYVGLAALQVGDDVRADKELAKVTQLVPAEPAGWANWGLLALRQRNFDPASERLDRARVEAPENDQIYYLIGLLEKGRGRSSETIAALRKAVELNPKNLLATFTLA